MFGAALDGDVVAGRVVNEVLDALVMALIALTVTADPELIILDGAVGRSLEPYLGSMSTSSARHVPWTPRLAISELGPNSTVVGAIASALWLDRKRTVPPLGVRGITRAPQDRARVS